MPRKPKPKQRATKGMVSLRHAGEPPPPTPAEGPRVCSDCKQPKPIVADGRCGACYSRKRRRELKGRHIPPKIPAPVPEGPPPPELLAEMQARPIMSTAEEDDLVIQTAAGDPVPPAELPKEPSYGHQRLWHYLRTYDAHFRRQIIARMLALGMDRLAILAAFVSDPRLRVRWVDPLRDPRRVFDRDFEILADKGTGKRQPGNALRDYIERLKMYERIALELTTQSGSPAATCREMLQLAHKLARDIALLEEAIRIVPAQGDLPTTKARAQYQGKKDADVAEEVADEEEETPSGEYHVPNVETGELE